MANLKISRMDYTSRIKGDDIFLLVQDGQNKIISAEDLVHNIDNALRNDKPDCHHHHYCGDDNPLEILEYLVLQALKDAKIALALAQDASEMCKETECKVNNAFILATLAKDTADLALSKIFKIDSLELSVDSLVISTEKLQQELSEEINNRIYADKSQDKVIETINLNLATAINTINTNMFNGFTTINGSISTLRTDVDLLIANSKISKTYYAIYSNLDTNEITILNTEHKLGIYTDISVYINNEEAVVYVSRNSVGDITISGNWEKTDTIIVLLSKIDEIK